VWYREVSLVLTEKKEKRAIIDGKGSQERRECGTFSPQGSQGREQGAIPGYIPT